MFDPPNSSRCPEEGRGSGDRFPRSGRRPGPDLIELDAFYNALVKVLIILAAAVALIFVVGP